MIVLTNNGEPLNAPIGFHPAPQSEAAPSEVATSGIEGTQPMKAFDGQMVRDVCEKVVALAREGEAWAVQAIFDRMDGKPAQAVTGADGGPLQFERIIRTIVDPANPDA